MSNIKNFKTLFLNLAETQSSSNQVLNNLKKSLTKREKILQITRQIAPKTLTHTIIGANIEKGKLVCLVNNAAAATMLRFSQNDIVKKINDQHPEFAITQLKVVLSSKKYQN